ncbi:hypothetical protein RINTHH_13870 [Richelia intracellularis HH01]|uniref:Uncharacterized protein n=1 Tax=Richelia intracellularis HH01 TaxID=1165094 RepID=M1WZF1_9NOST|nr:HAD hydrolase-like protein [Richelia intracellularis]CCH67542.1 hypothetical protein RINTHH_13870 [Richelia intracellularis HH01]
MEIEGIAFISGFEALFVKSEENKISTALATSSSRQEVKAHLRNTSYLKRFNAIYTSDSISKSNPDPEIYLLSASEINCQSYQNIALKILIMV